MPHPLKFAVFGTGFWAGFQIPAWFEVGGVELVALYNRTPAKAERLAQRFGGPHVYSDPAALLANEQIDFVDIIADVSMHAPLVFLAADHGIPVICQKPLAPDYETARKMVETCRSAGVPLLVHENFRWQAPMRAAKGALEQGLIGTPFRAHIELVSGYPVFKNQPSLAELEQFIIADLGSHTLDVARFLFGEMESLYCQTSQVHRNIKGEDVATIVMRSRAKASVVVEMAYAENYLENEYFPQTLLFVEGDQGSLELAPGPWLRVTTRDGTHARRIVSPRYPWADPDYAIVHASIVECNNNLLGALRGDAQAETTGEDNLETVRLVFAAYDSARNNTVISF